MTTVKLESGTEIRFYSSIKEMPMHLFNQMQGYLLQDAGVGSTIEDAMAHFATLDTLISAGKLREAATERHNLHFNIYAMLEGLSFKSLALGCMVHSVGGVQIDDYSEDSIIARAEELSALGLTVGHVEEQLEAIKKKSIPN